MDLLLAGGSGLLIFDIGFLLGAWWGGYWMRADRPIAAEEKDEQEECR